MDGDAVEMMSRVEGEGAVGDARARVEPHTKIVWPRGLTYAQLKAAGSGVMDVADDDTFRISSAETEAQPEDVTDDDLRDTFAPDLLAGAGVDPKP